MKKKVIILGASGFIGQALRKYFFSKGYEVVGFSRRVSEGIHYWNPEKEEIEVALLEDADLVINLAGESIFGRWNRSKKERVYESRVHTSHFIVKCLTSLKKRPKLYIAASAMGYYGNESAKEVTEKSGCGQGYLAELCYAWEESARPLEKYMRICFARFSLILGEEGGILKRMLLPFKLGIGGKLASGEQWMSWMAIDDLVRAMEHLLFHEEIEGAVNFSSPYPVKNNQFTKSLARWVRRPAFCTLPKLLLQLLFGEAAEVYLGSLQVKPVRLLESGFVFEYPSLESALKKYLPIKSEMV